MTRWIIVHICKNGRLCMYGEAQNNNYEPDCLFIKLKQGNVFIMIWAACDIHLLSYIIDRIRCEWISRHSQWWRLAIVSSCCCQTLPYFKIIICPYIRPKRTIRLPSNIFSGHHTRQAWRQLNPYGKFLSREWETDFDLRRKRRMSCYKNSGQHSVVNYSHALWIYAITNCSYPTNKQSPNTFL